MKGLLDAQKILNLESRVSVLENVLIIETVILVAIAFTLIYRSIQ